MTRSLLWGSGLVVCLAVVGAAVGGSQSGQLSSPRTSVSNVHVVQAPLSAATRHRLAGTITREQQLSLLRSDPTQRARLARLGVSTATRLPSSGSWGTGITLTPLTHFYPPAAAENHHYQLCLETDVAQMSVARPLPAPTQTPPLLWLATHAGEAEDILVSVMAQWPSAGAYMLTFFVSDPSVADRAASDPAVRPRVCFGGPSQETLIPSEDGDRWTFLLEIPADDLDQNVSLLPSRDGSGFTACCLSKVVVTKVL